MLATFVVMLVISSIYLIGHQHLKLVTNTFRLQHPSPTSVSNIDLTHKNKKFWWQCWNSFVDLGLFWGICPIIKLILIYHIPYNEMSTDRFLLRPQGNQTFGQIIQPVVQRGWKLFITFHCAVCHYFIIQNVFQTDEFTYIRKTKWNRCTQKPDEPEK